MKLSAAELHRRGRAHLNSGQNAAARRVLLLAAQRTDDPDLRARIAGSLAALTIRQGDPDAAELLCREALALPGVSDGTAAIVYGQLGLLALERGALDEAVSLLDRGIDGIGDEAEYRAPMLVNRSVAHSQAGRLAAARADVEAAARDYETVGGEVERAMAMHNAGYIALLEGDLIAALETMGRARGALAAASAVNAAICDLDRAEVLRDAGLAHEAEQSLERVITVFAANRMRQAKGESQFHLARSLLTHTPAKAARDRGGRRTNLPRDRQRVVGASRRCPAPACPAHSGGRGPRPAAAHHACLGRTGGRRHRGTPRQGPPSGCGGAPADPRTPARGSARTAGASGRCPHAARCSAPGAPACRRGPIRARRGSR